VSTLGLFIAFAGLAIIYWALGGKTLNLVSPNAQNAASRARTFLGKSPF
jgi:hypothetical protein